MKVSFGVRQNKTTASLHPLVEKAILLSANHRVGFEPLSRYVPRTLRYLVKCAESGKNTDYTRVSKAIGAGLPRNANWAFASIYRVLQLLQDQPKFMGVRFPDISSIVTKKGEETGGIGAFIPDPEILNKPKPDQIAWLESRRKEVFRFRRWSEVLAFLNITPMSDLGT